QHANEIRIKQCKRKIREAKAQLEANPGDKQAESQITDLALQLKDIELEHYKLCVASYPTNLHFKYEYGVRLMLDKKYDDAIPMLQEAQREPKYKIVSMGKIGLCFYKKGWYADAIDVFSQAIDSYEMSDDSVAKELKYNLASSYEHQGNVAEALKTYRKIAQLDYGYKDVRVRIDKLRDSENKPTSQ
ncbi:MAG: tetratricopeptide repeat protein, partial [Planctomycetota bacterium]